MTFGRGVRVAEGARLESACTVFPYRGFESRPLRQFCAPRAPSGREPKLKNSLPLHFRRFIFTF